MDRNAAREVERALEWLASEQTRLGGESLLVALSGGIDSMVLADLLMLAADRLGVNALEFAHIDHALRESSAAEARQVADWVHSRGYKIQTIRLDSSLSGSSGKGIEGWARQERYTALEAVRRKLGCRWLLTAHHRDDQAETVLMRLERGCGLGGLIGIKKCDPSRHLLRPLLERSVAELHEWCRRRELPWVEDESNRDLRFSRNEIRRRVLPALERVEAGSSFRLAQIATEASRLLPQIRRWALRSYPAEATNEGELLAVTVDPADLALDNGALLRLALDLHSEGRGWPSIDSRRWDRMMLAALGMRSHIEMLSPALKLEMIARRAGWVLRFVQIEKGRNE